MSAAGLAKAALIVAGIYLAVAVLAAMFFVLYAVGQGDDGVTLRRAAAFGAAWPYWLGKALLLKVLRR